MLWQGALDTLRLPGERISSRWLGTEALMLASAPYKSTKELTEDLQLATVKRLLPNIDQLPDDEALADAVLDVREVYEDTVYAVAHDVIAILKRYAEVDKAVSGKADLPLLSVLQSIREHIATLVYPGFIGKTPPDALRPSNDTCTPTCCASPRRKTTRTATCDGLGKPTKPNNSPTTPWRKHNVNQPAHATKR